MTQFTAPGFQIGDRAFTSDGREGTVTASRFSDDGGFWEHLLDPIFEFFPEFELSRDSSEPLAPAPAPELLPQPFISEEQEEQVGFVTLAELRELVLEIVRTGVGVGVTEADVQAAVNEGVERSNLIAQGNLQTHTAEVEAKAADVELFNAAQFSELESIVTTALSEIENRDTALEAAAEESSGTGFFGFVGGLGGLIKDPVNWIVTRLEDFVLKEVRDGLSR